MGRAIDVFRRRSDGAYSISKAYLEPSWAPGFLRDHTVNEMYSLRHNPISWKQPLTPVNGWEDLLESLEQPEPTLLVGRPLVVVDQGWFWPHVYEEIKSVDRQRDADQVKRIRDQTAKARASKRHLETTLGLAGNWVMVGGIGLLVLVFVTLIGLTILQNR